MVGNDDRDESAAALIERHSDGLASRGGSLWDLGIWAFALGTTALTLWYSFGPTPSSHGSDKQAHAAAFLELKTVWHPIGV